MKKLKTIVKSVLRFLHIAKKNQDSGLKDAIQLPLTGNQTVVEDFEMAAYHNQA
jgi:hypothetical protein